MSEQIERPKAKALGYLEAKAGLVLRWRVAVPGGDEGAMIGSRSLGREAGSTVRCALVETTMAWV